MYKEIINNFIKSIERYIQYTSEYNTIKSTPYFFNNGLILLNNIYILLIVKLYNQDSDLKYIYSILEKTYMYYVEFINNKDLLNLENYNENICINLANSFCIKKIFQNINLENSKQNNTDYIFYKKLHLIINIISNIYIQIYCYFINYNERYIFNNIIIDYINNENIELYNLENLLLNINNIETNKTIKSIIYTYYNKIKS